MWKVLYGKCPNDVNIQFSATLRHGQKAVIPTLNKCTSQRNHKRYDNSFAVIGHRLWNLIPPNMHTIEDPLHFKEMLTTFVKSFPDEPPVARNSCPNGNSLLVLSEIKAATLLSGWSATVWWPHRGFYEAHQSNQKIKPKWKGSWWIFVLNNTYSGASYHLTWEVKTGVGY